MAKGKKHTPEQILSLLQVEAFSHLMTCSNVRGTELSCRIKSAFRRNESRNTWLAVWRFVFHTQFCWTRIESGELERGSD